MKSLLFLLPLAVAPSQDPMDRDVQLLLRNDDTVALAKQQLGAKQITNVEYMKQIQELTKARNDILARHDRNGQRQLTALYTAAKKDQASAAQKAATEKAEADKQATASQARLAEEDAVKVAAALRRGARAPELLLSMATSAPLS